MPRPHDRFLLRALFTVLAVAQPWAQGAAPAVAGILNYTKVDATFACGGALSPEAIAAVTQAGYKSLVNLRAATEQGANLEEEEQAAKAAGIAYLHLPFTTATPDPANVDAFLAAVVRPENQPMLLHCATGARASIFWAIKRVMIDGWPVDRAMAELPQLGAHVSPALRAFALDYLKAHGKTRP
jgi:uncharacterized protein (TIGR01244 family)